ncbi:MAG: family 78 glycoside hydrolase catalytic domain [Clostridia bacterium]|nr:family 78 glycoside hydrolase catalytic domain [Clostridia bacterium]
MSFGQTYIRATTAYNTFEKHVPAYCFRREVTVSDETTATLKVAVCGIYELYLNGRRLTRGLLSPYLSNPEDLVYYDEYEITLQAGANAVGLILGNGFVNNPGGYIWDFDKASFRSSPKMALEVVGADGTVLMEGDTSFKVAPSPFLWDDYRFGECYDGRREAEIKGWTLPGFDDGEWAFAMPAETPAGELRVADVAPITVEREIEPVAVFPCGVGFIYDFGENNAGVCRLTVKGQAGQKIELRFAEALKDGDIRLDNVWFVREFWERDKEIVHLDTYICKGEGVETYTPAFVYHGFRYIRVDGITAEQATPDLLTYLVMHTEMQDLGGFTCSDPVANRIQEITRRSILSNFHHFPTDCPHREKNGWTADAALSCEAALVNFNPERNYREWMRNIRKAQSDVGSLPGIVPTGGWGFAWGNGPAWDSVLVYLPYFTYLWRGDTAMATESAEAFMAYLKYLRTRVDEKGLLHIGLGDWCHTEVKRPQAPLAVTDTIVSMDIANKMAVLLEAVGKTAEAEYARSQSALYREAIRAHLVDFSTMLVAGECQTSQAMALYYGVFDEDEKQAAFGQLLALIAECDDRMDLGVLGGRVIFHVLAEYGYADLAWKMAVEQGHPSYGDPVRRGATTLWESFYPAGAHWGPPSLNHHFWGDISAWFIKAVAGISVAPAGGELVCEIKPAFVAALEDASAYHVTPVGKITSAWKREGDGITLTVEIPEGMGGRIALREGYAFSDGEGEKPAVSGTYRIVFEK